MREIACIDVHCPACSRPGRAVLFTQVQRIEEPRPGLMCAVWACAQCGGSWPVYYAGVLGAAAFRRRAEARRAYNARVRTMRQVARETGSGEAARIAAVMRRRRPALMGQVQ